MKECPVCRRCYPDHVNHCPDDGDATTQSILGEPILDGRYQLERRLGHGGMGVVFQARHIFLKTAHAIKVILPDLVGNDPMLATRFRQEALAAAAIRHQNIIAVSDFGVVRGTMPFLVMEFVSGQSLHDVLAEEGALPPSRALEIISAVGAGVAAAHRQGIVHRDLKPLNIMFQENMPVSEGVKVLDFGLAKIKSGELLGSFVQAKTSGLMGSPFYMAPEQWGDEEPDARADIYSLGVILYQMLGGDVPFKGTSIPSIMKKHLTASPPTFASLGVQVPPQIEAVVRHALEKEAENRPASVEDFIRELRDAVDSISASLRRTTLSTRLSQEHPAAREQGQTSIPPDATTLRIHTNPPNSRVYINNVSVGLSDDEGLLVIPHMLRGAHRIHIIHDGYAEWEQRVECSGGVCEVEAKLDDLAQTSIPPSSVRGGQNLGDPYAGTISGPGSEMPTQSQAAMEARRLRQQAQALEEQARAEEEAIRRDEEERARAAEEARAQEEARLRAEEQAKIRAEEDERLAAEAVARRKADEEVARLRAEEEERLRAAVEEERRKVAEAARLKAEEEAARKAAEEDARKRAEEAAREQIEKERLERERAAAEELEARQQLEREQQAARIATTIDPQRLPPAELDSTQGQRRGIITQRVGMESLSGDDQPGTRGERRQAPGGGQSRSARQPFAVPGSTAGKTRSGVSTMLIAAIVGVVLIGGGFGVWFMTGAGSGPEINDVKTPTPSPPPSPSISPSPSLSPSPAPPEVFKPELVAIPGGQFRMGRDGGAPQEGPSRLVVNVGSFDMDKTEVTNGEYAAFVRNEKYQPPSHWGGNEPAIGTEKLPVVNVSYQDAVKFAEWRSKTDSVRYRLPTEEEWEYAARGGDQDNTYPWGNTWVQGRAGTKDSGATGPKPVGSYPEDKSRWGVLDMAGNVYEWTSSKASLYPGSSAQVDPAHKNWIVVRGGAYVTDYKQKSPTTYRDWFDSSRKEAVIGFRLVRVGSSSNRPAPLPAVNRLLGN